MKAVETIVHLRREMPAKIKNMVPPHVWPLVEPYGLTPADYEQAQETGVSAARQPTLTAPSRDQRQN